MTRVDPIHAGYQCLAGEHPNPDQVITALIGEIKHLRTTNSRLAAVCTALRAWRTATNTTQAMTAHAQLRAAERALNTQATP